MEYQIDWILHLIFTGLVSGLFYELWLILQPPSQRMVAIYVEQQGFAQYSVNLILYVTGLMLCIVNVISFIMVLIILISIIERSRLRLNHRLDKNTVVTDWWFMYWAKEKVHSVVRFGILLILIYLHIIIPYYG